MLLAIITGFAVVAVGLLAALQSKLIYHPRPYDPIDTMRLPTRTAQLEFTTSQGGQVAFYLAPKDSAIETPDFLWVYFNGNAGQALNWMSFADGNPDDRVGHLMVEYPGYGLSEGSPSPAAIGESATGALESLAAHLGVEVAAFRGKTGSAGHSLGAAAALIFATNHPVEKLILISPFTRMIDMARQVVGWPLCNVLRHRFDNFARLEELAESDAPPRVLIYHGSDDTIVPVEMAAELAASYPDMIEYHNIEGAGHNGVLGFLEPGIYEEMVRSSGGERSSD